MLAKTLQLHREYRRAVREFEQAFRSVVAAQNPGCQESVDQICREFLSLLD